MKVAPSVYGLVILLCSVMGARPCFGFFAATPTPPCDENKGNKDCGREPDTVEFGVTCYCGEKLYPPGGYACSGASGEIGAEDGVAHNFEFYLGSDQAGAGCTAEECVFNRRITLTVEESGGDPVYGPNTWNACQAGAKEIKCATTLFWAKENCKNELAPAVSCSTSAESYKSIRGDIYILGQTFPYSQLKQWFDQGKVYPLVCNLETDITQRIFVKDKGGNWDFKQGFCADEQMAFAIEHDGYSGGNPCFRVLGVMYTISETKCSLPDDNRGTCKVTPTCECCP